MMCIFCEVNSLEASANAAGLTDEEVLAAERCGALAAKGGRSPVVIVTGFLGSGKTTFVNRLLAGGKEGRTQSSLKEGDFRACVVQNEFGAASVDDAAIKSTFEIDDGVEMITLSSGCACCKVRGDLVNALRAVALDCLSESSKTQDDRRPAFDIVVVETSGLSQVGPVAQTFFADPFVQRCFSLHSIIAVVDASHALDRLRDDAPIAKQRRSASVSDSDSDSDSSDDDEDDESTSARLMSSVSKLLCEQLSYADTVLLNKADLVQDGKRQDIQNALNAKNSFARYFWCEQGRAPIHDILSVRSFSLADAAKRIPTIISRSNDHHHPTSAKNKHNHEHAHANFQSLVVWRDVPLDELAFIDWLEDILEENEDLYRAKGVVWFSNAEAPCTVQCVQRHVSVERMTNFSAATSKRSFMVLIGSVSGLQYQERFASVLPVQGNAPASSQAPIDELYAAFEDAEELGFRFGQAEAAPAIVAGDNRLSIKFESAVSIYREAILRMRSNNEANKDAASLACVAVSAECYTAWNLRKQILLSQTDKLGAAIKELRVVSSIQTLHPKAGAAWAHRGWLLRQIREWFHRETNDAHMCCEILKGELRACDVATKLKYRCYYAWTHRRRAWDFAYETLVACDESSTLFELMMAEVCVVREHVRRNVSDYSATCHLRHMLSEVFLMEPLRGAEAIKHEMNALAGLMERFPGHEALEMHKKGLAAMLQNLALKI